MVSITRYVTYGLFYVSLIFSSAVNAAVYDAYATKSSTIVNGEFATEYVVRNTNPSGVARYQNVKVNYPAARTTQILKSSLSGIKKFSPGSLALAAAISAAGWVIDELTGQITNPGSGVIENDGSYLPGHVWFLSSSGYDGYFATVGSAYSSHNFPSSYRLHYDGSSWRVQSPDNFGGWLNKYTYQSVSCSSFITPPSACSAEVGTSVISDVELIELAKQHLTPAQIASLLTDEYGNPLLTPELLDAMHDLAETETNPENSVDEEQAEDQEEPDWCDRKENKGHPDCEEEEEYEEPTVDEMPITTITMSDWDSGLGNGSCPASKYVHLQGQSTEFSYQIACDALNDYIKPLVLAAALIMSSLLLVGARS